jgi:hypothetical protein
MKLGCTMSASLTTDSLPCASKAQLTRKKTRSPPFIEELRADGSLVRKISA